MCGLEWILILSFLIPVSCFVGLTASDEIRALAFDIHLISSEYGFKHNLRQIKKFVCLRLAYCLSDLNMDRKHDSRIEMK